MYSTTIYSSLCFIHIQFIYIHVKFHSIENLAILVKFLHTCSHAYWINENLKTYTRTLLSYIQAVLKHFVHLIILMESFIFNPSQTTYDHHLKNKYFVPFFIDCQKATLGVK